MINEDLIYRYSNNVLKLQLTDNIDFHGFKQFLRSTPHQLITSRNESGRFIVFIKNPRKELFAWAQDFAVLRGATYLWHNDTPVTGSNYRTKVYDIEPTELNPEGEWHYDYMPWLEMTDVGPISEEIY